MKLNRREKDAGGTDLQVRNACNPAYPMQSLNGLVVRKPNRQAPQNDYDLTPRQFRRFVGATGVHDVQLNSGTGHGLRNGRIRGYNGEGYLFAASPFWPGQTRYEAGGYHKKGPDPLSFAAVIQNGPGSQPSNPGGPGKIAGSLFRNPMTG